MYDEHEDQHFAGLRMLGNWFKVLYKLNDDQIQTMNGTDYTLYLIFLRFAAWFCLVIVVINLVLFCPLYATGTPSSVYANKWSSMNVLTFMNITDDSAKEMFVYVATMLLETSMVVYMLVLYRKKYQTYKSSIDPVTQSLDDISISRFAVMVKGLPTNVGVDELQRAISTKMQKLYPADTSGKSPFVKARVIGDYNSLYKKCKRVKNVLSKLEAVRARNRESNGPAYVLKRSWLKCRWQRVDANDYYVNEINELKELIRNEKQIQVKRNSGLGFLIFSDDRIVKDILYDPHFFPALCEHHLSPAAMQRLNMLNWKLYHAFSESEIVWQDLYKDHTVSALKTFVLWILLLLLSVILLTPVMLADTATGLISELSIEIPFLKNTNVSTYVTTAMSAFFNVILIPFFIDIMVMLEDHPSKSGRQLAILNRNFFFMVLNSFLIPLTSTTTIKSILIAIA